MDEYTHTRTHARARARVCVYIFIFVHTGAYVNVDCTRAIQKLTYVLAWRGDGRC